MFGIPSEYVIPVANFIGVGILGILAYFGQRWGKNSPTPVEQQIEVAGALVDGSSVKQLAAALEAQTMEIMSYRLGAEKARQAQYRSIEVGNQLVNEIGELRHELSDLTREIARSK